MTDMRKCIGSAKFGIEAHEAPVGDFPTQPSQKDGLGRMCRPHWREYVRALGKARTAAKAGTSEPATGHVSNQQRRAMAQAAGKVPNADGTVQSQATARVATKRAARVAAARPAKKPEPIRTKRVRGRKTVGEQIVGAVDAAIAREAAGSQGDAG